MSHFYCRHCDAAADHATVAAAQGDGWADLSAEGRAGPVAGVEYTGTCPACR